MKKRLLPLLLALVTCLGMAAPAGAAGSDFVIENGVLIEYNGPGGDVIIPGGAAEIGCDAFKYCTALTGVTIPTGVTTIGESAFQGCTGLSSVTIPDSVTTIGGDAFRGCSSLTGVTIPSSVTEIGARAFLGCTGLTDIAVADGNPQYTSVGGVLFSADKRTLVSCPEGKQGSYAIPDGVTEIGEGAFKYCTGLTDVAIPDGVTKIGIDAFWNCTGLTGVTIPGSVTEIDKRAFAGCTGMTGADIPGSVRVIGSGAFSNCAGLTSVTIPDGVTEIDWGVFQSCTGLKSVTIPAGVTAIASYAFWYCDGLTDVYYAGSRAQWDAITVDYADDGNDALKSAAIHCGPVPEVPAANTFTDVVAGEYYIEPIDWAMERTIVLGYDDGRFGVGDACSQAHILTFLWRSQNRPEPAIANPYAALDTDEYYAKAAVWAYEKGLIADRDFDFGAVCTRRDVVTYLWKLAGSPRTGADSGFADVPAGLADAVNWAAAEGVTQGTSADAFSPDDPCTREQSVTFLYRAYK